MLDQFGSVAETVQSLRAEPFIVVTDAVPGQSRLATLHLSVSDATGDSAIFEYVDERLVIHHGRNHRVMTNSPVYDQQLALAAYWQQIGGTVMLPGTNRAADRFVRASFYIDAIPRYGDPSTAVPAVMSVMRNVSVPYGITTPEQPNISTTQWRVVIDHTNVVYHFESALSSGAIHVKLRALDLRRGTPIRRLELARYLDRTGDVTGELRPSAPMQFLPAPG
ncbi:MAG: linear amide C-N hydrolase [Myxococcales bacterium]|nr:linear amide C-N hydrolase [Myxococcales bacterium]